MRDPHSAHIWNWDSLGTLVPFDRPVCYGVLKPGDFVPDGVPLVRITDIGSNRILEDELFRISKELDHAFLRSKLLGGELLLSIQGTIGRVAIAPASLHDANISRTIARVALRSEVASARFYRQWFLSAMGQKALVEATVGTTRSSLNIEAIRILQVPTPPPDEQSRIACVLDTLDEAIAQTEAVIAKLRHVRTGLLHDLLTRGLDHQGQLRDPIAHPEQFKESRLGPIPKDWDFESVGERLTRIAGVVQTGPFGSQLHSHEYTNDGVPVTMPQDILEGTISTAQIARIPATRADELKRHRVRVGDIIFARRGDLSRCAAITEREVSWICGTGCLLMRFRDATLSPHWLSLVYRHDIGQRQIAARAVGTTMVNLNTKLLSHLQFAFPHKEEQDEVVRRVAQADSNIAAETEELAKLGLMKSGLMTDLLTGRVRVPEPSGTTP